MKTCETRFKTIQLEFSYREQVYKRKTEMNAWFPGTTSKRRDKLAIIAEILEIAKDGTLKTQIMYKANLSFAQLNEYLKFMLKTDLIEKVANRGKDVYVTTNKGADFLQRQSEITELLKRDDDCPKNGVKVPPPSLLRKY